MNHMLVLVTNQIDSAAILSVNAWICALVTTLSSHCLKLAAGTDLVFHLAVRHCTVQSDCTVSSCCEYSEDIAFDTQIGV